jgi:site-specific recombinase XerD
MEARREPKLLDQMRDILRLHQYSIATERVYLQWVRRFILFHGKRHPASMSKKEVEAFLTYLAVKRGVSATSQNVALAAIQFLYAKVLSVELPWLNDVVRAKTRKRAPVVLSKAEVQSLLLSSRANHSLILSWMSESMAPKSVMTCPAILRPWPRSRSVPKWNSARLWVIN